MQVVCKLVKVKCGLYCVHNKTEEGRQTKYDRKNSTGHFLTGELKTNILCLIKKSFIYTENGTIDRKIHITPNCKFYQNQLCHSNSLLFIYIVQSYIYLTCMFASC